MKLSDETIALTLIWLFAAISVIVMLYYNKEINEKETRIENLENQLYNDSIHISELQDSLANCKEHLELNVLTIRFLNDEICYIKGITREDCYYDKEKFTKIYNKLY